MYDDVDRPDMFKAQVEVKRIFKGAEVINKLPGVYPESNDIYWPWTRRLVILSGLGDPKICRSFARNFDTRIFMTRQGIYNELTLNSSLVRLTLDNIEHTQSAIEGSRYNPKPTDPPADPCERVFCAFGGKCVVDSDTNTGKCQCIEKCRSIFSPVCGSDNTYYPSECHLRKQSCTDQKRIVVEYQGSCNENVKDPCKEKECIFGAICVASHDGLKARCQCPTRCDSYGDSVGSTPVCGTDGRDYKNECEMRRAACNDMRDVEVKYTGKCDPCNGHQCDAYNICQLDAKRLPQCLCPDRCRMDLSPICGTDGKTYSSQCHLEVEACRTRKTIEVHHRGDCRAGPNPCARLRCGNGEECHVDRSGQARCICPPSCEPVQRPVCGTDGETYDNECRLRRQACVSKRHVDVQAYGRCSMNSPCIGHRCHHGAICIPENNMATCQCPSCSQTYVPVCGNNNITYINECELRATACVTQMTITLAQPGPCQDACSNVKCENYAVCEDDGNGRPSCVCSTYCHQVDRPVCGTDSVTYDNECEMKVASCQRQQPIQVASEGHCDRCHNVRCKFGSRCENGHCVCPSACGAEYDPVCASNSKTYSNECQMMLDGCTKELELSVEYSGECDDGQFSGSGDITDDDEECNEINCRFGGVCEFEISGKTHGGGTSCNCDFNCNAIRDTVCGSDGNTYGNACQLREQACKLQRDIRQVDMDECGELLEEACDGAPAEINPGTGKEYICSKTGNTCPANSYCHIIEGQSHGRCCRQDEQPIRTCQETEFGCCPDQWTAAPGPKSAGCPSVCECNRLGSQGLTCDPGTGQCSCKPGVGGKRCDRCEPAYWGLPRIADGNSGCIPCNCNSLGSWRDDCEQMNGNCSCRHGVEGTRCDRCSNGQIIGSDGCSDVSDATPQSLALKELDTSGGNRYARSCREMVCRYGAVCEMVNNLPQCVCGDCPDDDYSYRVCGSNGVTYASICQLNLFACRRHEHIHARSKGECKNNVTPKPTSGKSRKTTRHIDYRITNSDGVGATPSTVEYGWLGDICQKDSDCIARDSYCRIGLCSCAQNLVPNMDKTMCEDIVYSMLGDEWGRTYTVPSFSGINSYMQLKNSQAYREITIEITFKALSNEGILLYAGKSLDGSGDFISLSIMDGYVEFRFDLGSGHIILKSQRQVTLNKYHTVKAQRFLRQGMLYFDDMTEVTGESPGRLSSLNLYTDTYLGWVPNAGKGVYENIGTAMPFSGCIETLAIKSGARDHIYDLIAPESADMVRSQAIGECGSNACASMPCLNSGSCMSADPDDFTCKCQPGFSGLKCETNNRDGHEAELCTDQSYCHNGGTCYDLPGFGGFQYCECPAAYSGSLCEVPAEKQVDMITLPQFNGNSYLEIPLDIEPRHSMAFEVWFLALKDDGVILYSAQEQDEEDKAYAGDFIALNIVKGFLHYTYNLGSGIANITSTTRLPLNVWHRVTISRRGLEGEMTVNGEDPISGRSQGSLRILNIPKSVWLGGFPQDYNSLSGITTGLDGAVQRLYVDGTQIDNLYSSSVSHRYMTQYNGPPCTTNSNPCLNMGQCIPHLNDYTCGCTDMYAGKHCELLKSEVDTSRPISFDGVSSQEYDNSINTRVTSQPTNKYEIRFRTFLESGLLLLQHKTYTVDGDYLVLALRDGKVEASYNVGKEKSDEPLVIRSKVIVNDGKWHTLVFSRDRRKGRLAVDGEKAVTGLATDGATQLDTDGRLWIGGSNTPPRGLPKAYLRGFNGCMDGVKIDDQQVDLTLDRKDSGPRQYCDLTVL